MSREAEHTVPGDRRILEAVLTVWGPQTARQQHIAIDQQMHVSGYAIESGGPSASARATARARIGTVSRLTLRGEARKNAQTGR